MATTPSPGAPGVYVTELLTASPPPSVTPSPSVAGFAGEHWQGPSGPNIFITCNSWSDFVNYFGGFNPNPLPVLANPYLAYAVYAFFLNGGQTCQVQRIISSASPGASASVVLTDSSATPQSTLKLSVGFLGVIGNVGTWGNSMHYAVTSMPTVGRFSLNIYNGVVSAQNLVESWYDMSMSKSDPRYAVGLLNSPIAGSNWVVATDENDVDVFPVNMPAVSNGTFSGGVDCGDPSAIDRANAVTVGTSPFDYVSGALSFAMPGEVTLSVLTAAITYAEIRPYTFVVIDTPSGETPANAVAFFSTLTPVAANAAVYSPWVVGSNPATSNLSATILLPPSGFILGQYVATDTANGVWKAPAGMNTILAGVVQAERLLSASDQATLNNSNINALRTLPNGQVVIWGDRTMNASYASLFISIQRTLNYIASTAASLLESQVFAPNDQATWSTIIASLNNFLGGLLSAGAFAGTTQAQGYYIICDTTNNTAQSIAQGVLNVNVGLALLYPVEFINLTISQFEGTTTVTTSS
jgi:phage tail sheath protein FI